MDKEKYSSAVDIDEHALDKECVAQPTNYLRWSHRVADLNQEINQLDAEADVMKAELDNRIRETPAKYGLEKITETAVKQVIVRDKEYSAKLAEIRDLRHEVDLANGVLHALEHKKRMLSLLVELHVAGYYAAPKTSEGGREAVRDMTQRGTRRSRRE